MKLILGSQSRNRQEVLRRAGIEFEVLTADIDEKAIRHEDFAKLPLILANAKADTLVQRITDPVMLVTADTVTVYRGKLGEKPESPEEARDVLSSYDETHPIVVHSGLTVTNTQTGQRADGAVTAGITIAKLPSELIDELVHDDSTYTLAGGFTIFDERLKPYIVDVTGGEDTVAGLSVTLLRELLSQVA